MDIGETLVLAIPLIENGSLQAPKLRAGYSLIGNVSEIVETRNMTEASHTVTFKG